MCTLPSHIASQGPLSHVNKLISLQPLYTYKNNKHEKRWKNATYKFSGFRMASLLIAWNAFCNAHLGAISFYDCQNLTLLKIVEAPLLSSVMMPPTNPSELLLLYALEYSYTGKKSDHTT
jgi:hypothetical protein